MECLAVALKELRIPLREAEISSLKCSRDLQHIGYCQHGVLYVYHVIPNNGKAEKVQDSVSGFVWLTADRGVMEYQHLITTSNNCDVMWYKLTKNEKIVQVSLACSLTRARMSSISVKGGRIDAVSLHVCCQSNTVLALINGHVLCQLSINLSHNQLELAVCCNLDDDMSFMEAILGIQHSDTFDKLTYHYPLLLAVNADRNALVVYNIKNVGRSIGAVSAKTLMQQNPGSVMSSPATHLISCFDIASDLDTVVICFGSTVVVFKLSTYFTLNKEHLNPRFVHQLADKLVVRQSHGQGISYEEDEDNVEYSASARLSWHKQRSKLLHMINGEQVTTATQLLNTVKWYQDPSILYEEQVSNHGNIPITGFSSSLNDSAVNIAKTSRSYVHVILPMASQKVANESSNKVVAMVMSTASTVMVYYGRKELEMDRVILANIIVCSLDNKEYSNCRISEGSLMINVANTNISVAILSHGNLVVPILGLTHQDFVQKVLIYESAVAAETVCRLNQWDRCFLPINALETALELRQLSIVSFFLNPKEPTSADDEPALPVDLLDRGIDLLIRAIKKNLTEHKNSQFSSQLLNMTINFVNNLMKESVKDRAAQGPSLEQLNQYMLQLRGCIADVPKHMLDLDHCDELTSSLTHFGLSRKNMAMWNDLSREEVLRDALLKGCLPEAQYYFISNGITPQVAASPQIGVEDSLLEAATMTAATIATSDYTVSSILSAAMGFVLEAFMKEDVMLACNLLSQMGLNIKEALRYLCFNTFSRKLRTTIVEELKERDWLMMNELEALEYLQLLELIYPVRLYEAVKSFHFKSKVLNYHSTGLPELAAITAELSQLPSVGNLEELYPETFGGDYSIVVSNNKGNNCNGGYLHACLQLVLTWDQATRERLVLEGYQLRSVTATTNQQQLSWDNKIEYHSAHNNITPLLDTVTELLVAVSNNSESLHLLSKLINYFAVMTSYSNDFVRDQLMRQGVILANELEDFNKLMYRIGRTHCLLSQPHPLAHMSQLDVSAMNCSSFHRTFINYCVKNKFVSLLYHYLDTYNLAVVNGNNFDDVDSELVAQNCWVDVMLKFRTIAQRPLDPNAVFMASLSSSRLLLGKQGGTIMGMLNSSHPLIAMATLMYSNINLQEAMDVSSKGQDWYVDSSTLKTSLAAYPKLQDAVFPLLPSNYVTIKTQDISVYKLLQGNVSFNVAGLFLWQPTNILTKEGDYLRGASSSSEMPHFSLQSLATTVAPHYLPYYYHLLQAQPVFAYANFVAAKKRLGQNFNKEINKGVSKAYKMAMTDFANTSLTSSCIIFTELLSQDSTKLRVHLSTARRLLQHHNQFANDSDSISHQFFEMKSNPSIAQQILTQLEVATTTLVDAMDIEPCSIEALEYWQLIGSFCQLHGLAASKKFLIKCAELGKWLTMVCHAQQLHLSPDEFLSVIEHHFVESRIKEHLMLAISASSWPAGLLSPRSYCNAVMEQRSHKGVTERSKHSSSKIKRQLNVRARYYSKMGLPMEAKTAAKEDHVTSFDPINDLQADATMTAENEFDWQSELTADDIPGELFTVLFRCQQSPSSYQTMLAYAIPLQQPLLAILAACCEGANVISCMCVWLCTSMDQQVVEKFVQLLNVIPVSQAGKRVEFTKELQWRRWSVLDLAVIMAVGLQHNTTSPVLFKLLFKYFDPHNVLIKLMMFYEDVKFKADYIMALKHLQQFETDLDNKSVTGAVGDQEWIENIANFVTAHLLVTCRTASERSQLLNILSESNFAASFHYKTIDYQHLHRINKILSQCDLYWDLSFTANLQFVTPSSNPQLSLQDFYSVKVRVDTEHVIEVLIDKKEFTVAYDYASAVGASSNVISVREVQHRLNTIKCSELWKEEDTRIEFWLSTNETFQRKGMSPDLAADFFEGTVHDMVTSVPHYLTTMEQVLLLSLALQWHKQARQIDSNELKQREKEIWLSHIKCIAKATTDPQKLSWLQSTSSKATLMSPVSSAHKPVELIDWPLLALLDHHGPCALKELMSEADSNIDIAEKSQSLSKEEVDALEVMLGRLLNAGRVNQAITLSNLFEHGSPNLASVLCCIQLAQGKLSPDQLTPGIIKLLSTNPSSRGVVTSQGFPSTSKSQEVIGLMELLADRAPHAHHCCAIIIHCFRIALAIRMSYESIVSSDPLDTLTALLSCNQLDRISLAENFVQVCQLSSEEIADYLCDCVTSALKQYQSLTHTSLNQQSLMASALARANSRLVVYSPRMTSAEFVELIQLCPDPPILGCKLFAMINSNELSDLSLQAKLSVQVDLLIRAHDCFSIGCNIDGIAMVLELAHKLSDTLNSEKEFKLMVKLLTGIKRFREMSYIIDILVYNDEFETLLSKNVEKEEQFKTALLDYLKKYHNSDNEKLRMVAGKFLMNREQAKAIEEQAKSLVKSLKKKKLDPANAEVVKTLKNAYHYYQDAAANYAKDDCLTNTEQCMSQARLVALQLSIMKSDVRVINLDNKAVLRFLQEHNVFYEALIVADAYKSRVLIEWSLNLYNRVILAGDFQYYNDYKCSLPLTVSLFQELASRYRRDHHKSQQSAHHMKQILNDLPDLSLRYKLFQELGYGHHINDKPTFNPEEFIRDIARL